MIDSINEKYASSKMSTLLASEELKREYDEVFRSVSVKRDALLKLMKKKAGTTRDIEESFCSAVGFKADNFLTALGTVEREVEKNAYSEFGEASLKIIFDSKVTELLADAEVKDLISKYSEVYERLLEESKFFKRGVFNHTNANQVAKNLKDNGWFSGGHTVSFKTEDGIIEINNEQELSDQIEEEKQRILGDDTLSDMFARVDSKLTTKVLQSFRDHLISHPYLVAELEDLTTLKRRIWIGYLTTMKSEYQALMAEYDSSQETIKSIVAKADAELTRWESVIATFNKRFWVPFDVSVRNKADAVLGIEGPQIAFSFKDTEGDENRQIKSEELSNVLSNGERRALYILNIIFEVTALMDAEQETLFIVDDIADSFDYKNKYAIVEYLKDISEVSHFHLIVLTHNFDFYRTIKSRLKIYSPNKLIASKHENEIALRVDTMGDNPISKWTGSLELPESMIACIPFVRNLAEYSGDNDTYDQLTELLHIKGNTKNITFEDLKVIYQKILSPVMIENRFDKKDTVLSQITKKCSEMCAKDADEIDLRDKVVLSIGIRLAVEMFIISKLKNKEFVDSLSGMQTGKLIGEYKREFGESEPSALDAFERVLLMTPENIHMNSFMFEPILDMSPLHLRSLYNDVAGLSAD